MAVSKVEPERDVRKELAGAGLAMTNQRWLVLGSLHGRERPASAIELHEQLRHADQKVGLTTVYRTLHALAEAGLVHVFHRDGELAYRHCQDGPHYHLVCELCGRVVERSIQQVVRWLQQIRVDEDFVPNPYHSDLYGVCGACLRAHQCHHLPAGDRPVPRPSATRRSNGRHEVND